MKSFLKSALRITCALAIVAGVAFGAYAGWLGWQDRQYAERLAAADRDVDRRNQRELEAAFAKVPTYYCEKRAGMPVTEALFRIMHGTDAASVRAMRRSADSIRDVDAPRRWNGFHDRARVRRAVQVDFAQKLDAVNARAIDVAVAARPRTESGVAFALAGDPEYRQLYDEARNARSQLEDAERELRRSAPAHHLPLDTFEDELELTAHPGVPDLGKLLESATRPKRPRATPETPELPISPSCQNDGVDARVPGPPNSTLTRTP